MNNPITISVIVAIVGILSNIGFFGVIGFFMKRLVDNIDTKADKSEVDALRAALNVNGEHDKLRDFKLEELLRQLTRIATQMEAVLTTNAGSPCQAHSRSITVLETKIQVVESRVDRLETLHAHQKCGHEKCKE